MIRKAYGMCSDYSLLHKELEYIAQLFQSIGFLKNIFQFVINEFISTYKDLLPVQTSTNEKPLYLVHSCFGHLSIKMKIHLSKFTSDYFCHLISQFILVNK